MSTLKDFPAVAVPGAHGFSDVKRGKNSIFVCAGTISADLLRSRFLVDERLVVDIPTDVSFCPFGVYDEIKRESRCDFEGHDASRPRGVVYECWTQVYGELTELIVDPSLSPSLEVKVEVYEFDHRLWRKKDVTKRQMPIIPVAMAVGRFIFPEGSMLNVGERLSVNFKSRELTVVSSIDVMAILREKPWRGVN